MTDTLTIPEAAEVLKCTEPCARAMCASGRIPARKVGREWRLSRAAVEFWLNGESDHCQYHLGWDAATVAISMEIEALKVTP